MTALLRPTKVTSLLLTLAALLILSTLIASSYRATAQEETNGKTITPTVPNGGPDNTSAMNSRATCSPVSSGAMAITCDNPDPIPAFAATNATGTGIVGRGGVTGGYFETGNDKGFGVFAKNIGRGIGLLGQTTGQDGTGVVGRYDGPASGGGWGVHGHSERGFAGIFGSGASGTTYGVYGLVNSTSASGVYGNNDGNGAGVLGTSKSGDGISGRSFASNKSGLFGFSDTGSNGISGISEAGGVGVLGVSKQNDGISGRSFAAGKSGVFGFSDKSDGFGGSFVNSANGVALLVEGRAKIRTIEITGGGDLAEPFEITKTDGIQPGMVVAIDPDRPGRLRIARQAYDRTVAGIISSANGIKPGLTLKQEGTMVDGSHPVALTGRVYCWVDASNGSIEPGDLLTTSATPGHAMKVKNHKKASGAIIGKAMTELKHGKGLVLVLVTLQ